MYVQKKTDVVCRDSKTKRRVPVSDTSVRWPLPTVKDHTHMMMMITSFFVYHVLIAPETLEKRGRNTIKALNGFHALIELSEIRRVLLFREWDSHFNTFSICPSVFPV